MSWTEVARVEEMTAGLHLCGTGRKRVVLALINGDVFAFSPICPHAGGPMHLAETDGLIVACPLHGWRFDLAQNGRELHGYRGLPMYDVRVEHGVIYVTFPESAAAEPVSSSPVPV